MAHVCGPQCLALCKHAMAGAGIGTPKLHPAKVGRTPREKEYARDYPNCQYPGCRLPTRQVHHVKRRGMGGTSARDTSPLLSLCDLHHEGIHSGRIKEPAR